MDVLIRRVTIKDVTEILSIINHPIRYTSSVYGYQPRS
jgi:hypothetical protein